MYHPGRPAVAGVRAPYQGRSDRHDCLSRRPEATANCRESSSSTAPAISRYSTFRDVDATPLVNSTGNVHTMTPPTTPGPGNHERTGGVPRNYGPTTDHARRTQCTPTVNNGHKRQVIHAPQQRMPDLGVKGSRVQISPARPCLALWEQVSLPASLTEKADCSHRCSHASQDPSRPKCCRDDQQPEPSCHHGHRRPGGSDSQTTR
jgi:hypothetical protein